MSYLPRAVVDFLGTSPLAHVVTLGPDGAPHVSVAWVEKVSGAGPWTAG